MDKDQQRRLLEALDEFRNTWDASRASDVVSKAWHAITDVMDEIDEEAAHL